MESALNSLKIPILGVYCLFLKIGNLGCRAIRWLLDKCTKTKKIDQVAREKLQVSGHAPSPQKSLADRFTSTQKDEEKTIPTPEFDLTCAKKTSSLSAENMSELLLKLKPAPAEHTLAAHSEPATSSPLKMDDDTRTQVAVYKKSEFRYLEKFFNFLKEVKDSYIDLRLIGNDFTAKEIQAICDFIAECKNLKVLRLPKIDHNDLKKMQESPKANSSLKILA